MRDLDEGSGSAGKFRPAKISEYTAWLSRYVADGGTITHAYDYPWSRSGMLIAVAGFRLRGECGARSAQIICPAGIGWSGPMGHCTVYEMDGFRLRGGFVPVYSDPAFDAIPGVKAKRSEAAYAHARFEAEHNGRLSDHETWKLTADLGQFASGGSAPTVARVHSDEAVTVNVTSDGNVLLLPRSMPTVLSPDEAETLAYRILAAAGLDRP